MLYGAAMNYFQETVVLALPVNKNLRFILLTLDIIGIIFFSYYLLVKFFSAAYI